MYCPQCGSQNAAGAQSCRACGASLVSPVSLESIRTAVKPAYTSIRAALARLGISLSRGQIIGFIVSLIGGMIMARVLPFIYPIFDPILTLVFGSGPSALRDGFNTNMMTLITFATSFVLSFATMFLTTKPGQ